MIFKFSDNITKFVSRESLIETSEIISDELIAAGPPPIPELSQLDVYRRRNYAVEVETRGQKQKLDITAYLQWHQGEATTLWVQLKSEPPLTEIQ